MNDDRPPLRERWSWRRLLATVAIVIVVFASYYFVSPLGSGKRALTSSGYQVTATGVSKHNSPSRFTDQKNGTFFMHPGKHAPVHAQVSLLQGGSFTLKFWINNRAKGGNVKFTVTQNDKPTGSVVVKHGEKHKGAIAIDARPGDTLDIAVHKHGRTYYDLGQVRILRNPGIGFTIRNLATPIFWSLLLLLMASRRRLVLGAIAYGVFFVYALADKTTFGDLQFTTLAAYDALAIGLACLFTWMYQGLWWARRVRLADVLALVIVVAACALPVTFLVYYQNFHEPINQVAIFAIFQTNISEARQFLIDSISVKWLMLYVLIIAVITASLFWRRRTPAMRVDTTLLAFGTITFLGLASMSVKAMRVPEFVNHAAHTYRQQLITFRQMQKKRRNGQIAVKASKQHSGETYVVIIGESLNRRHMGLYGYFRNTTPKLDNLTRDGHLIVYDNVYSNYVNTMPALSYALTQASQYNHKNYYDAESIIDVARAAHFKSFWLSNQNLLGVWDNAVSVLAHSADTLVGINHSIGKTTRTQNFDGGLLRYVKRALDTDTHGNNIIFVHLMGSHFSYCKRFPKKYDIFHKTPTTAMMGSIVHDDKKLERRVNCYDNSVAYNDFVVSRIISLLRAHGGVSALTYFSDHADDVMGQLFHNASKFNFDMTAIPLMFWTSPGYAQRYPDKVKALRAHKNRLFTNDLVFNTVLGLAGIDTHYDKHGDLTSASYNLSSDRSRTLHGRKKITDDSDYIWWEHHNHALLTDKHLAKRVLPNHANTLGKLHQVWAGGYRSFAVDAWLTSAHHKSILRLGRKSSPAGTSLSAALVSIDTRHLDTLVINLRNLSAHNQDKVRAALDTLDARVGLKQRASLVTAAAPAVVTALRRDSWNVARRLPSAAIKSAIASGGKAPLTRLARKIARHVKTGNASGIAFEAGDYVFVKKYLATRLPDDLAWHVSTGFAFGKGELVGQLHKSSLPADQRVQTITGAYHSPFQL